MRIYRHFSIPRDHPSLPGHFPEHPIVPGVVLLERIIRIAQAEWGVVCLAMVDKIKFLGPVRAEQQCDLSLKKQGKKIHFALYHAEQLILTGDFSS